MVRVTGTGKFTKAVSKKLHVAEDEVEDEADSDKEKEEAKEEVVDDVKENADDAGGSDGDEEAEGEGPEPITTTAVIARRTARWVGELKRALDTWYGNHEPYEPGFAWWVEKPHGLVQEALGDDAAALVDDGAGEERRGEAGERRRDRSEPPPVGREEHERQLPVGHDAVAARRPHEEVRMRERSRRARGAPSTLCFCGNIHNAASWPRCFFEPAALRTQLSIR